MVNNIGLISSIISILQLIMSAFKKTLKFFYLFTLKHILKENFYIENCEKSVIFYSNGHGIVWNKFVIKVLKPDNFNEFKRQISFEDIEKYNPSFEIPEFNVLSTTQINNRFNEFGFWNHSQGITNVVSERSKSKKNVIAWKFIIDKNYLENNNNYITISYAFSVPNMCPLENGKCKINDYCYESEVTIQNRIGTMKYIFGFEKNINLQSIPTFNLIERKAIKDNKGKLRHIDNKEHTLKYTTKNDLFYTRYCSFINKPKFKESKIFSKFRVTMQVVEK